MKQKHWYQKTVLAQGIDSDGSLIFLETKPCKAGTRLTGLVDNKKMKCITVTQGKDSDSVKVIGDVRLGDTALLRTFMEAKLGLISSNVAGKKIQASSVAITAG